MMYLNSQTIPFDHTCDTARTFTLLASVSQRTGTDSDSTNVQITTKEGNGNETFSFIGIVHPVGIFGSSICR